MTITMHAAAEDELAEAAGHYEHLQKGLGDEFLTEFRRSVDRILQFPRGWQQLDHACRRCRLHRFPYGIVYRLDEQKQEARIIAVMHLHRRPGYWRHRI